MCSNFDIDVNNIQYIVDTPTLKDLHSQGSTEDLSSPNPHLLNSIFQLDIFIAKLSISTHYTMGPHFTKGLTISLTI